MNNNNTTGEFFKHEEMHRLDEAVHANKKEIKFFYNENSKSTIDVTLENGKQFQATCRVDADDHLHISEYKKNGLVEVHSCLAGEVKTTKRNEREFEISKNFDQTQITALRNSFKDPENSNPKPKTN